MKTECKRLFVTAIGINNEGITVTATNGNYNDGCTGEPGNCGCIHAEEELMKIMPEPNTVILSHSPCLDCAKLLYGAGVDTVVYNKEYRIPDGVNFLRNNGINLIYIGSWG